MADIFSKEKRSKIMASIRSKNTSIDNKMAGLLAKAGIKFDRYPKMFGSPDFAIASLEDVENKIKRAISKDS